VSFSNDSKYKASASRIALSPEGRAVTIAETPPREDTPTMGWHRWTQGQRLDLISNRYLNGAGDWWRLPDHNNQMLPEAAANLPEMAVPLKPRDR
jgi:hypothetical protein